MHYHIIPDASSLAEAMEIKKEYGISFEYNDFWHPEVYCNSAKIDELISLYKSAGDLSNDTMHGAFLGLDLAALDPILKERSQKLLDQSMDIANRLGVKGVVFHTGLIGGLDLDYYLENWLNEATSFWTKECEQYPDLTVYIENSFEHSPDVFCELLKRMGNVKNIKLCFDYAHAILTPTPIETWAKKLSPYIGHMHINDNDLKNDLHLPLGEGKIDFKELKTLFEKYELDCSVLLELNGYEGIKKSLTFVNELM